MFQHGKEKGKRKFISFVQISMPNFRKRGEGLGTLPGLGIRSPASDICFLSSKGMHCYQMEISGGEMLAWKVYSKIQVKFDMCHSLSVSSPSMLVTTLGRLRKRQSCHRLRHIGCLGPQYRDTVNHLWLSNPQWLFRCDFIQGCYTSSTSITASSTEANRLSRPSMF